ncbi:MAG TPA: VOC family protein [Candidatus Binataceae bacterium]|nr:VOC family protein [Candidatus Binataceae bacterium]
MDFELKRIVLFTLRMPQMAAFYRDVLGLRQIADDPGWKEFAAGGCNVALHNGTSEVGGRPPKMSFYASNVAAARELLIKRGAKMGKVRSGAGIDLCEGKDPDGNPFQLSSRK